MDQAGVVSERPRRNAREELIGVRLSKSRNPLFVADPVSRTRTVWLPPAGTSST
jgi:hypothetical protein